MPLLTRSPGRDVLSARWPPSPCSTGSVLVLDRFTLSIARLRQLPSVVLATLELYVGIVEALADEAPTGGTADDGETMH